MKKNKILPIMEIIFIILVTVMGIKNYREKKLLSYQKTNRIIVYEKSKKDEGIEILDKVFINNALKLVPTKIKFSDIISDVESIPYGLEFYKNDKKIGEIRIVELIDNNDLFRNNSEVIRKIGNKDVICIEGARIILCTQKLIDEIQLVAEN